METSHPTASAAFYKLFALGSSVPNIYLNPLIPSLNDFSDITFFMQCQNQKLPSWERISFLQNNFQGLPGKVKHWQQK